MNWLKCMDWGKVAITLTLSRNSERVPVSGIKALPTLANTGNAESLAGVSTGVPNGIRQAGTLEKVRFFVGAKPAELSEFYIDVYRYNRPPANSWTRVGRSENIAGTLVSNQLNLVTLASPISGVQEGDFVAFGYTKTGNDDFFLSSDPTVGPLVYVIPDPETPINYNTGSIIADGAIPIEAYMQAPVIVSISDSIFEGYPDNISYVDTVNTFARDSANSVPYLLGEALGVTVQNLGIGGEQSYSLLARFDKQVVAAKPRIVLIEVGPNDVAGGDPYGQQGAQTAAQIVANVTAMLQKAQAAGIIPVWISILGSAARTNAQSLIADEVNASIGAAIPGFGGMVIDMRVLFCKTRAGAQAGNRWDNKPGYFNADNLHFNNAGAAAAAGFIEPKLLERYTF